MNNGREMANEQNLVPMNKQPPEVRKELGSKGGKNSGKIRREKRAMYEILNAMINQPIAANQKKAREALKKLGINSADATNGALINLQLINLALSGQVDAKVKLRAIELIHRFVDGQKIDVTTNGKDVTKIQSEPLQLHIVTSTNEYKKILEEINKEKEYKNSDFGENKD